VTHSALLQPELSGVATFFIGFLMSTEPPTTIRNFTYWISKDE
jgi:hypothetical protein